MGETRSSIGLAIVVIAAAVCLGLGIFGPCVAISPGFGEYSPMVRLLKPDLTVTTQFSLFQSIGQLAKGGHGFLAVVVFLFSVAFPLGKLTVFWVSVLECHRPSRVQRGLRAADRLGKFSMADVFVIALLVVTIKGLPGGTRVSLGWGFWCFSAAVLLSLVIPLCLKMRLAEGSRGSGDRA